MTSLLFILVLIVTIPFLNSSNSAPTSINVFPRNSNPYGLSFEDHVRNYWKMTLAIPSDGHPWKDETGANCRKGQESLNSSIFYLPTIDEGSANRVCKIPAGIGLFIPVLVGEFSLLETGGKIADLPVKAKDDQGKMIKIDLRVNGTGFTDEELRRYSVLTGLFNATFADNGLFDVKKGGPTVVAADGYYVITKPLSKGTYNIYTHGGMCLNPIESCEIDFEPIVNTTLIVE